LTCFPSATAFALTLGADSPCADERCAGNLGLSASGPFTRFIATHVSIRTSDTSSKGYPSPSQAYGTLLYHRCNPLKAFASRATQTTRARNFAAPVMPGGTNVFRWIAAIRSFGYRLEPRYIFRAGRLDQ
jgi:hypothetical protein